MQDRQEGPVPAEPAGQPPVWEGDQRNAWLAPLKALRLKPYTFHECLLAAVSTRAHPERWGPLAQMLYLRAGRGAMDLEQALATVDLALVAPVPAELQALATQAGAVLAPHEQRVVQEAVELNARLDRLTEFVGGPVCAGLAEQDRRLLYRQHAAMTELAFVLAARIQRFTPAAVADSEGGEA